MSNSIVDLIVADHRKIEIIAKKLKDVSSPDYENRDNECEPLFIEFEAMIKSHAKAEEMALYSLFTDADEPEEEPLKEFALEGFEEHQLIDRLLGEMNELDCADDQWAAKLRVVTELVQLHMREEERQFLPKVRDALEQEELEDLGALYLQQQQELFKLEGELNGRAINVDVESLRN